MGAAGTVKGNQESTIDPLRIRAIVAGVELAGLAELAPIETAIGQLSPARQRTQDAGFTLQTLRLATNPLVASLAAAERQAALKALQQLDQLVAAHDWRSIVAKAMNGSSHIVTRT
jgi:uncharacterized protein